MSTIAESISTRMAGITRWIPAPAVSTLRVQRAIAAEAAGVSLRAARSLGNTARSVATAQRAALRTATGSARWAADESAKATRVALGQARAQMRIAGRAATDGLGEMSRTVSDAAEDATSTTVAALDAVETTLTADSGPTNETFDDLTKEELYRRAKALEIDGRSQMSKDELIDAVRAAA